MSTVVGPHADALLGWLVQAATQGLLAGLQMLLRARQALEMRVLNVPCGLAFHARGVVPVAWGLVVPAVCLLSVAASAYLAWCRLPSRRQRRCRELLRGSFEGAVPAWALWREQRRPHARPLGVLGHHLRSDVVADTKQHAMRGAPPSIRHCPSTDGSQPAARPRSDKTMVSSPRLPTVAGGLTYPCLLQHSIQVTL